MREYALAKEQYLLAAGIYNLEDADNKQGYIRAYIQAAWCLAKDNDINGALSMLRELLSKSLLKDNLDQLYKAMAEISKDNDDLESFYIYAEAALNLNPCDTDLRFKLAYTYSQNSNEQMALLHYKKHTDTTIDSGALNNLGVQYDHLGMQGKGVKSYYKAADLNETLSMANLAQKYLSQGFIDDAIKLIDRANNLSSEKNKPDYRVGNALKKVTDLQEEEEDKREQKILLTAETERKFRVRYSKAFCSEVNITKENIEGAWETPWGRYEMKFKPETDSFEIIGHEKMEIDSPAFAFLTRDTVKDTKIFKTRITKIQGKISNLSGRYTIQVKDDTGSTLLTSGNVHEAIGYMIVDDDFSQIEIMEKKKDNKTEYIQWKKLASSK
jgi:tetratricopeptide (TPR) repeat protein